MLQVGEQDRFEQTYTNRLKGLLAPRGQLLTYESDRAALDLGLHLYEPGEGSGDPHLGQVRVWFQLKGIRSSTLDRSRLDAVDEVPIPGLSLQHIQYWSAHPEPVYLVVYLEALDLFLAQDVRDLVERNGGFAWLREAAERQRTTTLRMPLSASLEEALDGMPRHRSLRLDGPDFRGRPLGHRLDPLRSELDRLPPKQFEALVNRLMEVHEFRPVREVDLSPYLRSPVGRVRALAGRLYLTYEWTTPLETEFGVGPESDFRIEARPHPLRRWGRTASDQRDRGPRRGPSGGRARASVGPLQCAGPGGVRLRRMADDASADGRGPAGTGKPCLQCPDRDERLPRVPRCAQVAPSEFQVVTRDLSGQSVGRSHHPDSPCGSSSCTYTALSSAFCAGSKTGWTSFP
jgi:hypothetical protein